jgi:AraC-like DNA-binding protein
MPVLVVLAALGAAQGGLLLILIALRYRHHKNVPLALLLIVFSLRLATIPTWNPGSLLSYPWILPATTPLPFLFGPLLWWYTREIGRELWATPTRLPLHFLPYAADVVFTVVLLFALSPVEYQRFVAAVFAGEPPIWMLGQNALKVLINGVYVFAAGRIAFGAPASRLAARRRTWLRALVLVPGIVLVAFAYVALFPAATANIAAGVVLPFGILAATMVALIYLVSLMVIVAPDLPGLVNGDPTAHPGPGIADDECDRLVGLLEGRLDKGQFHDPELSLADIATQLRVHPNRLSFAVNHTLGMPFRRLVNRKRLEYFMEQVEDGALAGNTILGLAFDAGFPSKSTFNRVFKEETGLTPSDFVSRRSAQTYEPRR